MRTKFLTLLAFVVAFTSCSIFTPVVKTVNDPTTPVGAIVADCAKPEIAGQIANVLAGINVIALDPSKAVQVKNDEIDALKKAGEEALACALRAGIADITVMLTGAVQVHASVDPRIVEARNLYVVNVFAHGYTYSDGWTAVKYLGAGGAGGSAQ